MLFGPLTESPNDMNVSEVMVGEKKLFVAHDCKQLSDAQRAELQKWTEGAIRK